MASGRLTLCLIFKLKKRERNVAEKKVTRADLIQINDYIYEIPDSFRDDMRVPARVFTNEAMLVDVLEDRSLDQLVNVATLPGIQNYAFAMPDIHQGYGFPIGGVAAMAINEGGVISPGGIGYDINCGVRLLVANMPYKQVQDKMEELATALHEAIPSGVGKGGHLTLSAHELDVVLNNGAHEMLARGYGTENDLVMCEEQGRMASANPELVSKQAKQRGNYQLGTLGSGNHFLEIQRVTEIYDEKAAQTLGLTLDAVTVMIHCGSRGLGHQVCTDYVRTFMGKRTEWGIHLPDRELICAPYTTQEAQNYCAAMAAAANFAWANRHFIGHNTRTAWQRILGKQADLTTMYDVSHNLGKQENHIINGKHTDVIVHRKGATRAFGPHTPQTPTAYQEIGQPVLIPGTMGTASYVLTGTAQSMNLAFGSSCHGAGRRMSRSQAKTKISGSQLRNELAQSNIIVRCDSQSGLAEEAPLAYKNINQVVDVVHGAGLAHKVARLQPLAVIKGG